MPAPAEADHHAVTHHDIVYSGSNLNDPAHALMAQNRRKRKWNVPGASRKVGVTHAACLQLHHHLIRAWSGELDLFKDEGSSRLMHDRCLRSQPGYGAVVGLCAGLLIVRLHQWWPPPAKV